MPTTNTRTFTVFKMLQKIRGVSASVWNGSNKSKNYIALATTLARVLSLDYSDISDLKVTPKATSRARLLLLQATPEVEVTYELKVQPGFGNSYTDANIYSDLKSKMASSTKSTCTGDNCFLSTLKKEAPSSISSGVNEVSYEASTPPQTVRQTPSGIESAPAAAPTSTPTSKSSAGVIAGAVVGALVAVGGIFYYARVYKPKLAKDAAAEAGASQVQGSSNPVHISPGSAASAPPPPPYPSQI